MEICEEADQNPVARAWKRWWKQERKNLAGERAVATETEALAAAASEMEKAYGAAGEVPMTEVGGVMNQRSTTKRQIIVSV